MKYTLSIDMYSGLPMIDLKLWSKRKKIYRSMFVTIDTGATITTLSKDILHILGYDAQAKGKSRITTASGVEYVDEMIIEKIMIGKLELPNIKVYAHTFPQESFSSGVLGLNVLRQFDIHLLFSKGKIEFETIV